MTISTSRPSRFRALKADRAGGLPERLALVDTRGDATVSHNARTTGWSLTRMARVSRPPVSQSGVVLRAVTIQVSGVAEGVLRFFISVVVGASQSSSWA
jgi:hypothetical protein